MDTAKGDSMYSEEKVACIHFTSFHLSCCFTGSSVSLETVLLLDEEKR